MGDSFEKNKKLQKKSVSYFFLNIIGYGARWDATGPNCSLVGTKQVS